MEKIYDALEKARKEERNNGPVSPAGGLSGLTRKKGFFRRKKNENVQDLNLLIGEQFKCLKMRLTHKQNGNSPCAILITSAFPDEGKSMVATNLAISLAKGVSEHVLLVDCDFKKPDLHKKLGLSGEKGLVDYLIGETDAPEIVIKPDIPKLSFIPAGKRPSNPLELLASEKMKIFVREWKNRYQDRYIIFDSSPIQITSEPLALLPLMDGILFVVRAGETNKEIVLRILQDIDKEKLLGIVLNGVEKSLSNRYYYNYYKYY